MKFEQGDSGMSAGFKKAGLNNVDAAGNLDTAYFINIAKVSQCRDRATRVGLIRFRSALAGRCSPLPNGPPAHLPRHRHG